MNEEQKNKMIADAENVEALSDFFRQWWSVADLYETAAKATVVLAHITKHPSASAEDKKEIIELLDQHIMMIDLLKPFERKEGEV